MSPRAKAGVVPGLSRARVCQGALALHAAVLGDRVFEARAGIRKNATFRFGLESLLDGIAAQRGPRTRGASHA
jgi:hypothetical protein